MPHIFLSYSRGSGEAAVSLASDFSALGHEVWYDHELSGGQAWWDQILDRVRRCDVFVFVLDSKALESTACAREWGYAAELGKPILPVLVGDGVSMNLLPPALSKIQFVDYREPDDRTVAFRLARALASVPPPEPLPNPLPDPPEVPISYLGSLTEKVSSTGTLSYEEQSALLLDLKRGLRDASHAEDARTLLLKLRKRRDLLATIAAEIDELRDGPSKADRATSSDGSERPKSEDEPVRSGVPAASPSADSEPPLQGRAEASSIDATPTRKAHSRSAGSRRIAIPLGGLLLFLFICTPLLAIWLGMRLSSRDESPHVLMRHEGVALDVEFSPDGTLLASASGRTRGGEGGGIRLWAVPRLPVLEVEEESAVLGGGIVSSVAFSPDGARLASASRLTDAVRLWSVETGEVLGVIPGHGSDVMDLSFSPDGALLALATGDAFDDTHAVRLWSLETAEEVGVLRGHEGRMSSVAFSPDGTRLASGSWDGTVRLWSVETGEELAVLRGHGGASVSVEFAVESVAFSPDGTQMASAKANFIDADGLVQLWSVETGEELAVLRGHGRPVNSVAFSPDGVRLASAGDDRTVRVWSVETHEELAVLRGHRGPVETVAFSPNGRRVASASDDRTVRLWWAESD